MTSIAMATAVSGLNASALQAQTAAHNIVNTNTAKFSPLKVESASQVAGSRGVGVNAEVVEARGPNDLTTNVISLNQASISYSANATVIRALDHIAGQTVDLVT